LIDTANTEIIKTTSNGAAKTARRPGRHRPDQVVAMRRIAWSPSPECADTLTTGLKAKQKLI
jgi:hypothetical protein